MLGLTIWNRVCAWLKGGYNEHELARRLDTSLRDLRAFNPQYRECLIPKRSGGTRRLLIPDGQTKALQRRILYRALRKLRAHPAALGFERGKSIAHAAVGHVGRGIVIKLDIENFFKTTSTSRVEAYFQRIGWKKSAAVLLTRLCTHDGGLPQGAPTSPRLANLVNYGLDRCLTLLAKRCRGHYTRYADDITFSANWMRSKRTGSLARGWVQAVRRVLWSRGYQLSRRKSLILRPHQRQLVAGLIVNEKVNLPRATRRRLRAIEHHLATGRSASLTAEQLAGWNALRMMIHKQTNNSTRQSLDSGGIK